MIRMHEKKEQLIKRIHSNYFCFKASLRGVGRNELFKLAGRIAAVTETYNKLTSDYNWDEESSGIDFFLLFRNPLILIADAWGSHLKERACGFESVMYELSVSDTVISNYPLLEGVDGDIVYIGDAEARSYAFNEI